MALLTVETATLLQEQEHRRIQALAEVEAAWYSEADKFFDRSEAEQAALRGELVHVPPRGDHYLLIRALRDKVEPDLLRPRALSYLQEVLRRWYLVNGSPDIRLAVTSLYRDASLQQGLLAAEGGYRSLPVNKTSHTTGFTFDLGANSCYLVDEHSNVQAVQKWSPVTAHLFRPDVFADLESVLTQEAANGGCNFIIEQTVKDGGLYPSVYHICVSPG